MIAYSTIKRQIILYVSVFCLLAFFIGWCTMIYLMERKLPLTEQKPSTSIWTVIEKGEQTQIGTLEELHFEGLREGDRIILNSSDLAEELRYWNLYFEIRHVVLNVYADSKLIYSYGEERNQQGKMVGSGYHVISLSHDHEYECIYMILDVTQNDAFTYIQSNMITSGSREFSSLTHDSAISLLIGSFLLVFGLLSLMVYLVMIQQKQHVYELFWLSMMSTFVGFWTLSNHGFMQALTGSIIASNYFEYLSLYLLPIPFLMLVKNMIVHTIFQRKVTDILLATIVVLLVVIVILHFNNIAHFPKMLLLYLSFCMIGVSFGIFMIIKNFHTQTKISRILFLTMGGFLGIVLLHLVLSLIGRLTALVFPYAIDLLTSFALLIMVMIFAITYLQHFVQEYVESTKQAVKAKLIYEDNLTGLYNRKKSTEILKRLEDSQTHYALLFFDLDYLKFTNDTFGHAAGDNLLCRFAKALTDNFSEIGTCIRMGGDEFLVILEHTQKQEAELLWKQLENTLMQQNQQHIEEVPLVTCCGIAVSEEADGYESCIALADKRMYDMKRIHHKQHNGKNPVYFIQ